MWLKEAGVMEEQRTYREPERCGIAGLLLFQASFTSFP